MDRKRLSEASKGVGKPSVGGNFTLRDTEGREMTERDLLGGFSLVSFVLVFFIFGLDCDEGGRGGKVEECLDGSLSDADLK